MPSEPSKTLQPVPNPHPDREYEVEIECPEFTALCPITGQPDFATITFKYIPGPSIVELKSLKQDFVNWIQPRKLQVVGKFNVRGGIYTTVRAEYEAER
jgi:7-cyano-7-deazaguanine reductase